ncbi:glycosyltransferase family 39 protein [Hydrogenophaga atypica]|uniref:Glycosyltransferase family 39 protein n=1 Tax=Hydrogenophaga atypica TaxID=249409 RepID=A0ABW2QE66_9BURK
MTPATPLHPPHARAPTQHSARVHTVGLVLVHALVWTLLQSLAQGNLDSYHDMLENFAWAQTFEWGTFKHPPFFAWVVGVWFAVFPTADWAYRLLAYTNVAVGLWGVAVLARRLQLAHLAPTALLLLLWALPYTTLAAKFNANSQLLSLWPWTAVALLTAMDSRGARGWAWHIALGLLAAACFLSKYYSGVFLVGFLVVALTRAEGRRWLLSPWPWLALAVFAIALLPHLAWLRSSDFATLGYAMDQGNGDTAWEALLKFGLTPLVYWGLAWLACVAVFASVQPARTQRRWLGGLARGLWVSWRPTGWDDAVFWLAVLPGGITLLFGLAGAVELSTPWSIPIGYAFSLLWLRNLSQDAGPDGSKNAQRRLHRAAWPVLALVVAVGLAHGWQRAQQGHPDHYRPSEQAAQDVLALWAREVPGVPLGWSGGAWADNALLAFYADRQIRALPGLPDVSPATLAPHADWATQGGVLLCPLGRLQAPRPALKDEDKAGTAMVPSTRYSKDPEACLADMRAWLTQQGQASDPVTLRVARQGWRFPRQVPFEYAVFFYRPAVTPAAR